MRICLLGATGLVGSAVIGAAVGRGDVRLVAVSRREVPLPPGARMEVLVGERAQWPGLIAAARAQVLVCALGTTMAAAGSREAFRAVDHDLVLEAAQAARAAGIEHMVLVSSVGAARASRNFYLSVKGETEDAVARLGFRRLDILRPGLLRGRRAESRPLERAARLVFPLVDRLALHGGLRRYRSVRARTLAGAILSFAHERAQGRFAHDYDGVRRAFMRGKALGFGGEGR